MNSPANDDPFQVLGISVDASEEDVRARYLELVKQFPPDREPEKFRDIRAAYEVVKDPYSLAERLLIPPSKDAAPSMEDALAAQRLNPPRFSASFLLSLGNKAAEGASAPPHGE